MAIYTIGIRENYRSWQRMAERTGQAFEKLGKDGSYPGGTVWATFEEAKAYLEKHGLSDFAVWAVDADWENDTYSDDAAVPGARHLLRRARLVHEVA